MNDLTRKKTVYHTEKDAKQTGMQKRLRMHYAIRGWLIKLQDLFCKKNPKILQKEGYVHLKCRIKDAANITNLAKYLLLLFIFPSLLRIFQSLLLLLSLSSFFSVSLLLSLIVVFIIYR